MITREQLIADIDLVDEANIEVLHTIILALQPASTQTRTAGPQGHGNPLKNSVTFETDVLSPIGDEWSVAR